MQNNWREQLKASASGIGWIGITVLILSFLAWQLGSQPKWLPQFLLVLGVVLVVLFVYLSPETVRAVFVRRQTRYGSNALVMTLALLGILFFVNVWSNNNHKRWDLTQNKQFSLSPQTIAVLKGLTEPIKITGFYVPEQGSQRQQVEDLLQEYRYHTNLLQVEFVDPDQKPGLARQLGISSSGVLVFQRGDKKQESFAIDEQDITSNILKVSRDVQKTIYFTTGHGERDPENSDPDNYSQIKTILERDNYLVKTLNLATVTDTLPSDVAAIVVAGPTGPFAPQEADRLGKYLDEGGKVMVLADPTVDTGLDDVLARWGVTLRNDAIIDPASSFYGDVATPLVSRYNFHTITKDLGGLSTFFPLARSISATLSLTDTTVTTLIQTSANAWGETDLQNPQASLDPAKDSKGPLVLAVAVEKTEEKSGRLVAFGDSDFASDNALSVRGTVGNPDLFRNAINWLAEEESLIAIGPKSPEQRTIRPLTDSDKSLLFYSTVIILPLAVLLAGCIVWWNRR
ncbi:MAG: GldG family protein [Anaerolineae bacterium]|nr:GldG family protein [Anaerolineae bacterium]